ncbi:uncharacterized protein Hap1MRO34_004750 [Clarias gariepinus]
MDLLKLMSSRAAGSGPLVYTAGAAAAAVSVYSDFKRGEKSTSDSGNTTGAEDPVCVQATELAVVQPTDVPQDQAMDSVNELEERIGMSVTSNDQLEERMKELEQLLSEANIDCDMKSKESEQEWEAENDELKKILIHNEELLKFTLAEAPEAVESITQLETESSELMDKLKTLQSTVKILRSLLYKSQKECDDLTIKYERELEAHTILQVENDEIKKNLIHNEELLKVALKAKKKAEEAIANLEAEKSELITKVKKKQSTVQKVRKALYKTEQKYEDLMNGRGGPGAYPRRLWARGRVHHEEREQEHEVHTDLQAENDKIEKSVFHNEELLKIPLMDAKKKDKKTEEATANLKAEKPAPITKVKKRQRKGKKMRNAPEKTEKSV